MEKDFFDLDDLTEAKIDPDWKPDPGELQQMEEYENHEVVIKDHQLGEIIVYDEMGRVMFRMGTEMSVEVDGRTLKIFTCEDK